MFGRVTLNISLSPHKNPKGPFLEKIFEIKGNLANVPHNFKTKIKNKNKNKNQSESNIGAI